MLPSHPSVTSSLTAILILFFNVCLSHTVNEHILDSAMSLGFSEQITDTPPHSDDTGTLLNFCQTIPKLPLRPNFKPAVSITWQFKPRYRSRRFTALTSLLGMWLLSPPIDFNVSAIDGGPPFWGHLRTGNFWNWNNKADATLETTLCFKLLVDFRVECGSPFLFQLRYIF